MGSNTTKSWRRTGLSLLVICALLVATIGPALAAPRVFVTSASIETEQVLAGEPTNVTFELKNTGDSGARTIEVLVNGSAEISKRYSVESGEVRTVTEQLTFEEPGTYNITVDDKHAGNVSISRTVVETTADRSDGRSMLLRAKRVPYNSRVTAEFPATDDAFVVQSIRMQSTKSEFTRSVETYTVPENASFAVPEGSASTLVGAAAIQPVSGVDDLRVRIGVNRSALVESDLSSDEVTIYRRTDDGYERLPTEQVTERDSRYIYETTASDTGQFVVGTVPPRFEVSGYSLSATDVDDEKRIVVSANVTNTGGIKGNYTATLLVDDDAVNNETIGLEPGEERSITLSHRITEDGSYSVALDEQSVGTVVLSSDSDDEATATATGSNDETTDEQSTDQETTESADDAAGSDTEQSTQSSTESGTTATDDSGDGAAGIPLPGSDDVGLTEVAIGVGVAIIGIILVLLQRW